MASSLTIAVVKDQSGAAGNCIVGKQLSLFGRDRERFRLVGLTVCLERNCMLGGTGKNAVTEELLIG